MILTRHLKSVHGIYVNTITKGDNQLQSELPTRMSEEGQYRKESHRQQLRMDQEDSEEECEPRTHPVEGLYTLEKKLRNLLMMP